MVTYFVRQFESETSNVLKITIRCGYLALYVSIRKMHNISLLQNSNNNESTN